MSRLFVCGSLVTPKKTCMQKLEIWDLVPQNFVSLVIHVTRREARNFDDLHHTKGNHKYLGRLKKIRKLMQCLRRMGRNVRNKCFIHAPFWRPLPYIKGTSRVYANVCGAGLFSAWCVGPFTNYLTRGCAKSPSCILGFGLRCLELVQCFAHG